MNEKLLKSLMDLYFENIDDSDLSSFHDTVIEALNLSKKLSKSELYDVFITLPQHLFGGIVKWDMSDTEVGDEIYEFLEKNKNNYKI